MVTYCSQCIDKVKQCMKRFHCMLKATKKNFIHFSFRKTWFQFLENKKHVYVMVVIEPEKNLQNILTVFYSFIMWMFAWWYDSQITDWGRVRINASCNLTIIGSDNGLSPGGRQAIIWTNAGKLLMGPLGTNFSEIWNEIRTFSFKKVHLKISSGKWRSFCLSLNMITCIRHMTDISNELLGQKEN